MIRTDPFLSRRFDSHIFRASRFCPPPVNRTPHEPCSSGRESAHTKRSQSRLTSATTKQWRFMVSMHTQERTEALHEPKGRTGVSPALLARPRDHALRARACALAGQAGRQPYVDGTPRDLAGSGTHCAHCVRTIPSLRRVQRELARALGPGRANPEEISALRSHFCKIELCRKARI